jgi:hypothetical protein
VWISDDSNKLPSIQSAWGERMPQLNLGDAAWVQSYAAIIAAMLAVVGLFFNWYAIRAQIRNSRAEKQIDVIMECNRRYEHSSARIRAVVSTFLINHAKASASPSPSLRDAVDEPFRGFWLVFYEEWQFYRVGMVPSAFFNLWCMGLVRNFGTATMEGFGEISLTDAWNEFGISSWGYAGPFVEHIHRLQEIAKRPSGEWQAAVENATRRTAKEAMRVHRQLGTFR